MEPIVAVLYCVVYVTVPNDEVADKLTAVLLEEKLVACVNKIPGLQSSYLWKGKVEVDSELLLMMKTKSSLMPQLVEAVKKNHPYDVPEVISVPIQQGNEEYLQWIDESTKKVP